MGFTLFELLEHVRVRRKGPDRYVRIADLPAVRRYAPQAPDEEDLMRDMPTGRFVLRAYASFFDAECVYEWTEKQVGELVSIANPVAAFLEQAVPDLVKRAQEAERRRQEYRAHVEEEARRRKALERAAALQRARHASKEELRLIVKAWNDAFALEAFFSELSKRAEALAGDERTKLEAHIQTARELMGGRDAVDRFLRWSVPSDAEAASPDGELDDHGDS